MGDLLLFSSGPENLHYVDEIKRGKRYTMILWFTLNPAFGEDARHLFASNSVGDIVLDENDIQEKLKLTRIELERLTTRKLDELGVDYIAEQSDNKYFAYIHNTQIPHLFNSTQQIIDYLSYYDWKCVPNNKIYESDHSIHLMRWSEYKNQNKENLERTSNKWTEYGVLFVE
eukprot:TRINITY_DN2173_c0_g1_i1.p2 TRINITY_DN2173_c0_g1~~TRINITY_DN2173_c0_g1_i1.p2  ORF type:complete len:172 (+),score=32.96 TRINITY_DN2173_c0_g1_i1:461-976(+)